MRGYRNITFELMDGLRVGFVTQSLIGRWLYQLFLVMEQLGSTPSESTKYKWLGLPLTAISFLLAVGVKILNHRNQDNYPAWQDRLFAVFSSSILFFFLDLMKQNSITQMTLPVFILTSTMVPIASFTLARSTITDSTNYVVLPDHFHEDNFPVYPTASPIEKWWNTKYAISLSTGITCLFWVINRELNGRTTPMDFWQIVMSIIYGLAMTVFSYQLTDSPKRFHVSLALSKALRDGSLAYAALSGIGFHVLDWINGCLQPACWSEDPYNTNKLLTTIFIPLAALIGLFSAATTKFDYEDNHSANEDIVRRISECDVFTSYQPIP